MLLFLQEEEEENHSAPQVRGKNTRFGKERPGFVIFFPFDFLAADEQIKSP